MEAALAATVDGRCLEAIGKVPQMESALKAKHASARMPAGHVLIGTLGSGESDSRERYTLSHLYAKGGMGQVWLAHDAALGREIALKEIHADQVNNCEVCSRFLTEARITAQLEHPGIVPVYELGETEPPFYTMRFVKGGTLSQATRPCRKDRAAGTADPVGMVKLLGAFVGVCHALAYAHSRGVIHRNLEGPEYCDRRLRRGYRTGLGPGQTDRTKPRHGSRLSSTRLHTPNRRRQSMRTPMRHFPQSMSRATERGAHIRLR